MQVLDKNFEAKNEMYLLKAKASTYLCFRSGDVMQR